jgi:hypothetical protein
MEMKRGCLGRNKHCYLRGIIVMEYHDAPKVAYWMMRNPSIKR